MIGPVYLQPKMRHPVDIAGGYTPTSRTIEAKWSRFPPPGMNSMVVAAVIDIEALRKFRTTNLNSNWTRDLRRELFSSHV